MVLMAPPPAPAAGGVGDGFVLSAGDTSGCARSPGGGAPMSVGGGPDGCAMSGGGLGGHSSTGDDCACALAAQASTQAMKKARQSIVVPSVIFASCSYKINRG